MVTNFVSGSCWLTCSMNCSLVEKVRGHSEHWYKRRPLHRFICLWSDFSPTKLPEQYGHRLGNKASLLLSSRDMIWAAGPNLWPWTDCMCSLRRGTRGALKLRWYYDFLLAMVWDVVPEAACDDFTDKHLGSVFESLCWNHLVTLIKHFVFDVSIQGRLIDKPLVTWWAIKPRTCLWYKCWWFIFITNIKTTFYNSPTTLLCSSFPLHVFNGKSLSITL